MFTLYKYNFYVCAKTHKEKWSGVSNFCQLYINILWCIESSLQKVFDYGLGLVWLYLIDQKVHREHLNY